MIQDAPIRVQVVAEPALLREVLCSQLQAHDNLLVVQDIFEADVLVTTSSHGPLQISRLADTTLVEHPSQLVAAILKRVPTQTPGHFLVVIAQDVVLPQDEPGSPAPKP